MSVNAGMPTNGKRFLLFFLTTLFCLSWNSLQAADLPSSNSLPSATTDEQAAVSEKPEEVSLDFADGLYGRKMYGAAIGEYQKFLEAHPDVPDAATAYFRIGESYYFSKDYPKAIAWYERFRAKFPDEVRVTIALFRTATAKYYAKNIAGAKKAFAMLETRPADDAVKAGTLFYRARIQLAENQPDQAIATLRNLTERYPDTEYTMFACLLAADTFRSQKNDTEALRLYALVVESAKPLSAAKEAAFKAADLSRARKEYAAARDYFGKALEFGGGSMTVKVFEGVFYSDYYLKDLEAAKDFVTRHGTFLEQEPIRFEIYYFLAVLAYEKKEYVTAFAALSKILNDPQVPEAEKFKAAATAVFFKAEQSREEGRFDDALAEYTESLQYKDSPYFKPSLYQAGFLSLRTKKIEIAKELFTKYIDRYQIGEEVERAILAKIQIDLDAGDFEATASGCRAFLDKYPKSKYADVALYKLGTASTGLKDYDGGIRAFQKILSAYKTSPLLADAAYGYAAGWDGKGDLRRAIAGYESFTRDFSSHPLYADALLRLGFLYIQNRDHEKAARLYENILLAHPEIPLESDTAFWTIRYALDHGEYDRMTRLTEELPARYPKEDLTHESQFFKAESLMGTKKYEEAVQAYTAAIQADPQGIYVPQATLGTGIALAAQGHRETAAGYFSKALAFNDNIEVTLRARFEIANMSLAAGKLSEAAKAFMHVAILYDDEKYCSAALYKAGECFAKLGNLQESQQAFEELLKRYPKSAWADKAGNLIKKNSGNNG